MKDLFTATTEEREIIERIAKRAADIMRRFISPDRRMGEDDIMMYLEPCHCNGCPRRLEDMASGDHFSLMHDIYGISSHINTSTGELDKRFLPRFFDASKEGRRHE